MLREPNKQLFKSKYLINYETNIFDETDFLYQVLSSFYDFDASLSKDSMTIPQLVWHGVKKPLGDLTIEQSLDKMIEIGYMEKYKKSGTVYYRMIDHPW